MPLFVWRSVAVRDLDKLEFRKIKGDKDIKGYGLLFFMERLSQQVKGHKGTDPFLDMRTKESLRKVKGCVLL